MASRMRALEAKVAAYRSAYAGATGSSELPPDVLAAHLEAFQGETMDWGEEEEEEEEGGAGAAAPEGGMGASLRSLPPIRVNGEPTSGGSHSHSPVENESSEKASTDEGDVPQEVLGIVARAGATRPPKRARSVSPSAEGAGPGPSKTRGWTWRTNRDGGAGKAERRPAVASTPVVASLAAAVARAKAACLDTTRKGNAVLSEAMAAGSSSGSFAGSGSGSGSGSNDSGRPSGTSLPASEISKAAFVIMDAKATGRPIVWASPGFFVLSGYEAQNVLGRGTSLQDLIAGPGTDSDPLRALGTAMDAGRELSAVLLSYRASGPAYWAYISMCALRNEAGELIAYVGCSAPCQSASTREGWQSTDRTATGSGDSHSRDSADEWSGNSSAPVSSVSDALSTARNVTAGKGPLVMAPVTVPEGGLMLTAQQLLAMQEEAATGPSAVARAVMRVFA